VAEAGGNASRFRCLPAPWPAAKPPAVGMRTRSTHRLGYGTGTHITAARALTVLLDANASLAWPDALFGVLTTDAACQLAG
jgi:hypothetical protein